MIRVNNKLYTNEEVVEAINMWEKQKLICPVKMDDRTDDVGLVLDIPTGTLITRINTLDSYIATEFLPKEGSGEQYSVSVLDYGEDDVLRLYGYSNLSAKEASIVEEINLDCDKEV